MRAPWPTSRGIPRPASLARIARFLDTLGYRPHPFRAQRAEERRRAEDRAMMLRIGVAGALAGNVMMLAVALYSGWFGGMEPEFERYFRWLSLLLTAPALIWPGRVFFRGAVAALRTRRCTWTCRSRSRSARASCAARSTP